MRLDKYLKVSRIVKRRTVANEICDAGRAEVNGRAARASYDVKVGDIIALNLGGSVKRYEVLAVNEFAPKDAASAMYRELS
ncbi:MAG TPA: RNA-binding S4 domain-containing protein [Candidatus Fimenecus stercoravium]|nr:RNA-binding S4 domain-containing protein [Candidatus Fimenecus stercoravium]